MRRKELPPRLADAFSVGESDGFGVPRSRLRGNDLESPFFGVRQRVSGIDLSPEAAMTRLAEAYATRMGAHEFFSHVTGAVVWSIALPRRLLQMQLIDVAVVSPARAPRSRGVRGHEINADLVSIRTHPSGLRLASPASAWAMLGPLLSEYDLVAAADAIIREPRRPEDPPRLATLEQLDAALRAGRRPGIRALRQALARVRPRVDSRKETHLRLTLVDGGLPEPVTGYDVLVGDARIARVDLAYPERRIAIEYEGEHHLSDTDQWTRDIHRYERLAAAGWTVIRVTKADLRNVTALVARVRAALAA